MRYVTGLTMMLALLVGGCSGSDDAASVENVPIGSAAELIDVTSGPTTPSPTKSLDLSFDPAWVIQTNARIVVLDADGTETFSPTGGVSPGDQNNPDWSPDGLQLTFTVADGDDDLWVVDVDGSNARVLAECTGSCTYYDDPAWAPDGRSVAACKLIEADAGPAGALVSIDVETGTETVLAEFPPAEFCAGPRFSPDGGSVVLEVVELAGPDSEDVVGVTLTVLDLASAPPARLALTDSALFAATADWSPDGDLMVYSALSTAGAAVTDLFTIRPDGSDLQRLTTIADQGGLAVQPSFDASGDTVVFVDDSVQELRRVDLTSGQVTPAFPTDVFGNHPRAQPGP